MLRKTIATLLLLLAVSPFTAPFATCDVSTLFGHHPLLAGSNATLSSTTEEPTSSDAICATAGGSRMPGDRRNVTANRHSSDRVECAPGLARRHSAAALTITLQPARSLAPLRV